MKAISEDFIKKIKFLLEKYDQEEKCGIFFNLNESKNPLDIIGVLEFLKYKIQKWGNTNIFTYEGVLFSHNKIIVIGSRNVDEAITIIIFVYLTKIIENEELVLHLAAHLNNQSSLESLLKKELETNIKRGYPNEPQLEKELKNHIKNLLNT